jgi:hypothetical protein
MSRFIIFLVAFSLGSVVGKFINTKLVALPESTVSNYLFFYGDQIVVGFDPWNSGAEIYTAVYDLQGTFAIFDVIVIHNNMHRNTITSIPYYEQLPWTVRFRLCRTFRCVLFFPFLLRFNFISIKRICYDIVDNSLVLFRVHCI